MVEDRVTSAREAAWRELPTSIKRTHLFERVNGAGQLERVQIQASLVEHIAQAGWDAQEERYRALVEAARRANLFFVANRSKLGIRYAHIGDGIADALRALEGQPDGPVSEAPRPEEDSR